MNILKWLFELGAPWKTTAPAPKAEIFRRYSLNANGGNPFDDLSVMVLDVKNGWVKYMMGRTGAYTSSMKEEQFLRLYTIVEE